jgi:hypothetical protein
VDSEHISATMTYVMWHREHFGMSVLQTVHLSNLVTSQSNQLHAFRLKTKPSAGTYGPNLSVNRRPTVTPDLHHGHVELYRSFQKRFVLKIDSCHICN